MTAIRTTEFLCPRCNARCVTHLYNSVNVTLDRTLRDKVFDDTLNRTRCEQCGGMIFVPISVLFHDMRKKFLVWFRHWPGRKGPFTEAGFPYDHMDPPPRGLKVFVPVAFTWGRFKETILFMEQSGQPLFEPPHIPSEVDPDSPEAQAHCDRDRRRELFHQGKAGPEDVEKWREESERGDVESQFMYAFVHYRGTNVAQDYALARKWFTAAAQQNHIEASFYLGAMLENGWGGAKDFAGAAILYRKAAEANFLPAQHNLGMLFQKGNGVPKSLVEACFWMTIAAQNNGGHSQEYLPVLEKQMTSSEIEAAGGKAAEWRLKQTTKELQPIMV